ncbi:DUF2474 family protein [Pseudomonas stutzeri]|uniref:Cyanide insensitive terminal oxidase, subunit III n=1 Tax=Stutzerimonas stutzeri KOS6 TaxID=1218352 RepID=A0A061JUZ7_STUST|nr:DUF2474 domain-containing protein [Stutzerimonas stutzeri]EWC42578.1 hypothetical protein B597_003995 [Stutzerimonas stutzeri KOS6]MBK3869771.1 DUF2474 family protein [Stutzerimonas stutzeri]
MDGDHEKARRANEQKPLWQRMSWLVLIWGASVLALGIVAWLLRLAMNAAGLAAP